MTANAELAARFDRVLSALGAVIATATALDQAWEETKKGVVGAYAAPAFSHSQARRAFEDETPTMDALAIDLKDNRYKDPSWPTDGADDVQILRSAWHAIHNTIGAGKPFAPDDLSMMPNLYAVLERAREKLTRRHKTSTRKRSKKAEVILKVRAAILYKIDNPGATASKCALRGEISYNTLRQNPEWREWSPKIEHAAHRGTLRQLKAEWDRKTGQFLAVETQSDGEG